MATGTGSRWHVAAEVDAAIKAEVKRVAERNARRRPAPQTPLPEPAEPLEPLASPLVKYAVLGERKTKLTRWRPSLVVATADRRVHVYEGFSSSPDLTAAAALSGLVPSSDECLRGAAPPSKMPSSVSEAQTSVQNFFAGAPAPLAPVPTMGGAWVCTACTFENPNPNALVCDLCNTVRPVAA
mgnify:CR=1 FL=1